MDILYTLKCGSNCDELTYSLRSLCNLPHDKVFIVGDIPANIRKDKVIYIHTEQTGTKWRNAINNIKTACADSRLSDDFVLFNDDFFVMQPITVQDLNVHWGTVQSVYDIYYKRNAGQTNWCKGMKQTQELMQKCGIEAPLCYDLHTPMVFNKHKFLQMFDIEGVADIDVLHARSLYGNLYGVGGAYMYDVKYQGGDFEPKKYEKFLSCSNAGFSKIKNFLDGKFKNKSEYEV